MNPKRIFDEVANTETTSRASNYTATDAEPGTRVRDFGEYISLRSIHFRRVEAVEALNTTYTTEVRRIKGAGAEAANRQRWPGDDDDDIDEEGLKAQARVTRKVMQYYNEVRPYLVNHLPEALDRELTENHALNDLDELQYQNTVIEGEATNWRGDVTGDEVVVVPFILPHQSLMRVIRILDEALDELCLMAPGPRRRPKGDLEI